MGLFDRFKKKNAAFKQDLTRKNDNNRVFIMHLLMEDKVAMPSEEDMVKIMSRYLGDVDCFFYSEKNAGFVVKKHIVEVKEARVPPQLLVMECLPTDDFQIDTLTRSQMWDCPESGKVLEECKYHVVAIDVMADLLPYKDRAKLDMDYMEALMELYPECRAVYFQTSGKMFTREKIVGHTVAEEDRFIHFAVNARILNVHGTSDYIVDTVGMSLLGLPDLQYHFRDCDLNWVVNHAYNTALYIFGGERIIGNDDYVSGIKNGELDHSVRWKCHHEESLIQPMRPVVDVYMNEYAAGKR